MCHKVSVENRAEGVQYNPPTASRLCLPRHDNASSATSLLLSVLAALRAAVLRQPGQLVAALAAESSRFKQLLVLWLCRPHDRPSSGLTCPWSPGQAMPRKGHRRPISIFSESNLPRTCHFGYLWCKHDGELRHKEIAVPTLVHVLVQPPLPFRDVNGS